MHLGSLRGMRIGIEAAVWLRKIDAKEPYQVIDHIFASLSLTLAQVAMGGIPLTLQKNIDDDLARFACEVPQRPLIALADRSAGSEHGIKPFFVFNGLAVPRKDRPSASADPRISKRFRCAPPARTQNKRSMSAPLISLQRMGGAR